MSGPAQIRQDPERIIVLAGGTSAEREVSLSSGAAVHTALCERGVNAELVDPAITDLHQFAWRLGDLAFISLHGTFGEDGEVQQLLDAAGVPYTGSAADASRLAFSKSAAKLRFQQHHVPTPPYVLVHRGDSPQRLLDQAARVGYPLAFKPDQQGSSLGISFVHAEAELDAAADHCFSYGPFAVLERAVPGTEWTLGVIDEDPLPLIQIRTPHDFFDYDAKYQDEQTEYLFDFTESTTVTDSIRAAGRAACRALGTSGIARVDIRLDGDRQPWVLEVNTIPGMTDHSLVPKAAARTGMAFGDLCLRAVEVAVQRHERVEAARSIRPPVPFEFRRQAG
jgi:D-alanine-D-alanine ligase